MKTALGLPAEQRAQIAQYAKGMLSAAGALGRVPTPLDEVAAALKLSNPQDFFEFDDMPPDLVTKLRRMTRKARGAFDIRARTIYVARDQPVGQQRFTLGHEIGHSLPWHKDAYYCDDSATLDPLTRDELEAEASALGAELIYNLGEFTDRAHSSRLHIGTAVNFADEFGVSRHSGIRRYVEDAPGMCALLELGRFPNHPGGRKSALVLRGFESTAFLKRFGQISECLPKTLAVEQYDLAKDAFAMLGGALREPVVDGEITLFETNRGAVRMKYELFCNFYRVFALILPRPRIEIRRPSQSRWTA